MKKIDVGHYVGAFIDICGQSVALKESPQVLTPESFEEARNLISRAFQTVNTVRGWFDTFYQSSKEEANSDLVRPKHQDEFSKLMQTELYYREYSDGLFAYVPLKGRNPANVVNGVWALLCASGATCQLGLAHDIPLRVGIDLSWGAEINSGELYGRVLADAHDLESKIAKHPRVVVGNELVKYLERTLRSGGSSTSWKVAIGMAELSRSIIDRDLDDQWIVDYLGPGFQKRVPHDHQKDLNTESFSGVKRQLATAIENNNVELIERYTKLLAYYQNRLESSVSGM